jgi:putative copper export protein/mono/diheme cytochrome c family protein
MPDVGNLVALLARLVQIAGACLVTGIFAFLVFAARPAVRAAEPAARERFDALERCLLGLALVALAAAIGAGLVDLARQALVARDSDAGELTVQAIGTLLAETRFGGIWLVRHAFWFLLLALLLLRGPERDRSDWLAVRIAGLLLAAGGLTAGAASGHAATAAARSDVAIAADALHLIATGVWAGALVPFVLFLRWVQAETSRAPQAIAAGVAVRRFSTLGLSAVVVLIATGVYAVLQQVGSVPALVGTIYGRWLLLKLVLLVPLLSVAYRNRTRLSPRLEKAAAAAESGGGAMEAGPLVARLGRFALLEALLVTMILGIVAVLGLTTPARHDPIAWPLPFRFTWQMAEGLPGVWLRVAIGGQLAILGLVTALVALVLRRRWWRPAFVSGVATVGLGLAAALPPLVVDAYPTTYVRPTVAYTAASIARGHALYREHCASCHGVGGAGDGPAAASTMRRPADLIGRRTADRTAGDLFWWLTHGAPGLPLHGFGNRLSPEQRWDAVNFLRTLAAAERGRGLGLRASDRSTIVAPDVGYTTGVGAERSLREYRRTVVLFVLFRVPESFERLSRLGRRHFDFRLIGAEIVGVPVHGARTLYRALGARPVLFPLVIEGAEQATAAYGLFRRDPPREDRPLDPELPVHMELLIDRQGYLRARWTPSASVDAPGGWNDIDALLREIARLAEEPAAAPIPGEHVH